MQAHFEQLTQSLAQFLGVEFNVSEGETRVLFNFEKFPVLVKYLGAEIQAGEGETRVFFDFEDFPVLVEYLADARQVLLAVSVAALPEKNRAALYLALLQGQYFFQRTAGATLAVDEEARFAALHLVTDIETLTPENFPALMENFLRVAEDWHDTIERFGAEESAPSPAVTADLPLDPGSMLRA
jgi:hypothetical protein